MRDIVRELRRPGTDFVREPVDGLRGWSGDLVVRGRDDFCVMRSAVLFRSKWCELYRVGVEVHQEGLEPVMVSRELRGRS